VQIERREKARNELQYLVDVGNALAQVELGVLLGLDAFDLQECVLDDLLVTRALVAQEHSLGIQTDWLTGRHLEETTEIELRD
jgi:hypothetical protein